MAKEDFNCNHCDKGIEISEHELWHLYSEDNFDVDCPYCNKNIKLRTIVQHTFIVQDEDGFDIE